MKLGTIHSLIGAAIAAMATTMPQLSPAAANSRTRIERKAARQLSRNARMARVIWDSSAKGTYVSPEGAKRMRARRAQYRADSSK